MIKKTNAELITDWQEANPGMRLTAPILREILGLPTLSKANLSGANLSWADLYGADLSWADLSRANLSGANLSEADLSWANLSEADLSWANLTWANLTWANLTWANLTEANLTRANLSEATLSGAVLIVDGLPSGPAKLVATPDGWVLRVGCWAGEIAELKTLISHDYGWPEAEGAEIIRRRPGLLALINICEANVAAFPNLINELAKIWRR